MKPEEFTKALQIKAKDVEQYAQNRFPAVAGDISLRFINGNFRAQGFQAKTFKKWKKSKGTTLVKSGHLRNATYYTTQPGQVTIRNNMPYAKVHNEGFQGKVNIKAHKRNQYNKVKSWTGKYTKTGNSIFKTVSVKSGEIQVKAHTRKVNLPQRQFIPTANNPSPVLNNAINRAVTKDLIKIINHK